ncbi:unnamed protein product [Didymodactylos carnosus]|uniref:Uncharacterized protein n=1 Tax=Didymodactylos carnosus TaxID=1234261 RepID=A0A814MJU4_9BILA|nr:unnamed protein product [Didymodactylos carnosus]CAF3846704.1 unnamed protein product [Didymodactylos carnosus]
MSHLHAAISLNESDKLRLIGFPPDYYPVVQQTVRNAIQLSWSQGIQREQVYSESYEFKLNGNPWHGQGNEAIPSRLLLCSLIQHMSHIGWRLLTSTDIQGKMYDKDTLLFVYDPSEVAEKYQFFIISFNENHKLRFINCPIPIDALQQAIVAGWPSGIHDGHWKVDGVCYQFKLRGNPWFANGHEAVFSRLLLVKLLDLTSQYGYELRASVDINIGVGGQQHASRDKDTWVMKSAWRTAAMK